MVKAHSVSDGNWGGNMPRHKKYNPKQLRAAVNDYFASISYMEKAQRLVATGETNRSGMPVMAYEDIKNVRGEYVYYREYAYPPTMEGLCRHLGITRQALNKYKADEKNGRKYADIIESARMVIEEYLHVKLNTKDKGQAGIQFDLQCNHGWRTEAVENEKDSGVKITIESESEDEALEYSG